jgi:hypothetical protein
MPGVLPLLLRGVLSDFRTHRQVEGGSGPRPDPTRSTASAPLANGRISDCTGPVGSSQSGPGSRSRTTICPDRPEAYAILTVEPNAQLARRARPQPRWVKTGRPQVRHAGHCGRLPKADTPSRGQSTGRLDGARRYRHRQRPAGGGSAAAAISRVSKRRSQSALAHSWRVARLFVELRSLSARQITRKRSACPCAGLGTPDCASALIGNSRLC